MNVRTPDTKLLSFIFIEFYIITQHCVTTYLERDKRIELSASAWRAEVLPLYESRMR